MQKAATKARETPLLKWASIPRVSAISCTFYGFFINLHSEHLLVPSRSVGRAVGATCKWSRLHRPASLWLIAGGNWWVSRFLACLFCLELRLLCGASGLTLCPPPPTPPFSTKAGRLLIPPQGLYLDLELSKGLSMRRWGRDVHPGSRAWMSCYSNCGLWTKSRDCRGWLEMQNLRSHSTLRICILISSPGWFLFAWKPGKHWGALL